MIKVTLLGDSIRVTKFKTPKNKSRSIDLLLFFEMKRTLRCIKHEVAYGYEARLAAYFEICVRFAS